MPWTERYKPLQGVRLNMVAGADGSFVDENRSSRGISSDIDRELLVHLRKLCDVVVTGGETARVESYLKPKSSSLAIISRRPVEISDSITLTPPPSTEVAAWCIAELNRLGFNRILLEVGPSLAREFLKSDLVDEFCLTLPESAPKVGSSVMGQLESHLQLAGSHSIEGTLFTIWRRGNGN